MSSRDFGFLTLRNVQAYQSNGNPVPPNQVLVTTGAGQGGFTNSLIISTICVSTVEVSTIYINKEIASTINTSTLTANILTANTLNASTILVSTLNANILNASSINVSTLNSNNLDASTINVSTLNGNNLDVSTINVSTLEANTLQSNIFNTNFLTVNSTTNLSTTIINNTLALVGSTPADSQIWLHNYKSRLGTSDPYGGLYLEASTTTSIWFSNLNATNGPYAQIGQDFSAFYGSVNVASTLYVSTLDADIISSFMINVQSTITFYDGPSTVELNAVGSTLYVNGHPILSGGSISSVSSLFWQPGPNGTIFNENVGTSGGNYNLVGIGTNGSALQATLDIRGTTQITSSLTVSSIFNAQNINTISNSAASASNQYFIDYTQDIGTGIGFSYPVLRFNSQVTNPNIQNKSLTLTMADGVATWSSQWEGYLMQDMKFICQDFYVSSIADTIIESLSTINLTTPVVTVSNNMIVSSVSTNTINMNNGVINSEGTNLTLSGPVYISSFGSNVASANLHLFNNAANFVTNPNFDGGFYIEVSSPYTTNFTDINANNIYATIGPASTTFNVPTVVNNNTFQVTYDKELQPFKGLNGNYLYTKPGNTGFINLGAWNESIDAIPLCLQVESNGDPTDNYVGINTASPGFTLDVNGPIRTNNFLSTNTINMGNTNSAINFNSILDIDSYAAGVDNGIINIGTAYNPTINFGSAGTSHTITMNGDLNIQRDIDSNYTTLNLINISNVSSSVQISMQTGGGSYSLYATDSEGSPAESGLIPSTFQIYSYYPTPTPVLTIYPNGNLNVKGFITPTGTTGNRLVNNIYDTTTNITLSALMPAGYNISNNTYIRLVILAIGAGGGGAGAFTDGQAYGGAGGGSGQEVTVTYYVLPTAQLAITIGTGGAGGTGISGAPNNNTRGTNGGTTIITSSNNATILVSAAGGNGADNNGLIAVNPDFGGNGYYGGGGGGGNDTNFINTGGASCVLYSIRTGNNRYIPGGYTVAAAGGTGDGPAGPGTGGIGGTPNANTGYSGGGGASSALGTGGNGGNGSSNSNINGTNGTRGAGGGGGGQANSSYGNGGIGGNGSVQIQIFAL